MGDLPVYECPQPASGATVQAATIYNASQEFAPYPADGVGYDAEFNAVTSSRGPNAEYEVPACLDSDMVDSVYAGEEPDAYVLELTVTLPSQPDAMDYQGSYAFTDAPIFGSDPAMIMLIGWYQDSEGGMTVTAGLGQDAGFCLSRIRPDRITGALWWTAPDDRPDLGGPFYFTFDVGERGSDPAPSCFYTNYYGVTKAEIWPETATAP